MIRRPTSGLTGVDFAVSIATLMLVITALFDLGTLIAARHSLNFGVFAAARFAAVNSGSTSAAITSAFTSAVKSSLGPAGAANCTVSVTFPTSNAVGGTVTVAATYPWSPSSLLDGLGHITLSSAQSLTIQH